MGEEKKREQMKTKYDDLIAELFESDEASALTNQAARAIEQLTAELINARATFNTMTFDHPDMNQIGARVSRDRIDRFLDL